MRDVARDWFSQLVHIFYCAGLSNLKNLNNVISRAPAAKAEPLFKVDFIGARMAESYLGGCMPKFSISALDTS